MEERKISQDVMCDKSIKEAMEGLDSSHIDPLTKLFVYSKLMSISDNINIGLRYHLTGVLK